MDQSNKTCPQCGQAEGSTPHAAADGTFSCAQSPVQTWPTITDSNPTT
ncbi:MAG: hypothetical protein M3Z07_02150 [Candidatus Eremiobacteraeota bacterium]|nr:hypothetical protein [Candidatus Eremiobacteraeota bacterium]